MSSTPAIQRFFTQQYWMDNDVQEWIPDSAVCAKHRELLVCFRGSIPNKLLQRIDPDQGNPIEQPAPAPLQWDDFQPLLVERCDADDDMAGALQRQSEQSAVQSWALWTSTWRNRQGAATAQGVAIALAAEMQGQQRRMRDTAWAAMDARIEAAVANGMDDFFHWRFREARCRADKARRQAAEQAQRYARFRAEAAAKEVGRERGLAGAEAAEAAARLRGLEAVT